MYLLCAKKNKMKFDDCLFVLNEINDNVYCENSYIFWKNIWETLLELLNISNKWT